jgi:hypothetical protein
MLPFFFRSNSALLREISRAFISSARRASFRSHLDARTGKFPRDADRAMLDGGNVFGSLLRDGLHKRWEYILSCLVLALALSGLPAKKSLAVVFAAQCVQNGGSVPSKPFDNPSLIGSYNPDINEFTGCYILGGAGAAGNNGTINYQIFLHPRPPVTSFLRPVGSFRTGA